MDWFPKFFFLGILYPDNYWFLNLFIESACAEDVTGLKYSTEAAASVAILLGRGALCKRKKVHREVGWTYHKCKC